MKLYLTSPFSDKQVKIGGGLKTPEHVKSGGFRYDIVPTGDKLARAMFDQDFVSFSPLNGSYAVYRLTGTSLYVFYVHVTNVTKTHIKKGTSFATVQAGKWLHVHIKEGSYAPTNNKYIDWMYYVDPSNTITTVPGVNESYKLKKGQKAIMETPNVIPPTIDLVKENKELQTKNKLLEEEIEKLAIEKVELLEVIDKVEKDLKVILDDLSKV